MASYIYPTEVVSPKAHWHLIEVILDRGEGNCAYALGTWDDERRIGFRWNGSKEAGPIGNPQSRGLPTWTILDPALNEAIVSLLSPNTQTLAKRFLGIRSDAQWRLLQADVRHMHQERLQKILAGTAYAPLLEGALLVMHLIPFGAIDDRAPAVSDEIFKRPEKFPPIGTARPRDARVGFEGLLTGSHADGLAVAQRSYAHVTKTGVLEAVVKLPSYGQEREFLLLPEIQALIVKYSRIYSGALTMAGIAPPYGIAVSIIRAKGARLLQDFLEGALPEDIPNRVISEDNLSFSEVMLETAPADYGECAREISSLLNHIANTAGLASSPYFDAEGNYTLATRLDMSTSQNLGTFIGG